MSIRIGNGYDVHRLVENRPMIIGGVNIPYELGLDGHSDADVLVHSIMDSILGAAALGDIGTHFPDTDPAYKNADSIKLLKYCGAIVLSEGYIVGNIDAIIVAQAPKMKEYIPEMRNNIANALRIDVSRVNVKATTEENLGFTGAEEGLSSYSVCLLIKKETL